MVRRRTIVHKRAAARGEVQLLVPDSPLVALADDPDYAPAPVAATVSLSLGSWEGQRVRGGR